MGELHDLFDALFDVLNLPLETDIPWQANVFCEFF